MFESELHLDWETFSDRDLKKVGMWKYFRSPNARILCGGYRLDRWDGAKLVKGAYRIWDATCEPAPADLKWGLANAKVKAFNAAFEAACIELLAHFYGLPIPKLEQWRDTQAIAAYCTYPISLDACAKALGLQGKDPSGMGLLHFFTHPQAKTGVINKPKDHPEKWAAFKRYCIQDVVVEDAVTNALPVRELPPIELKVWQLDYTINRRGLRVNVPMCRNAAALAEDARERACLRIQELTCQDGEGKPYPPVQTLGQRDKIIAWIHTYDYELPGPIQQDGPDKGKPAQTLEKTTVNDALSDPECPLDVRKVLELRKEANLSSVKKYASAVNRADAEDDRCRGMYLYHRASPGRWAGTVVQFQNIPLPEVKLFPDDFDAITYGSVDTLEFTYAGTKDKDGKPIKGYGALSVLRDGLRNMVIAAPGHVLLPHDFSAVEVCGTGWLFRDETMLKLFRDYFADKVKNPDPYRVQAGAIHGKPWQATTDVGEYSERQLGKRTIIGGGYGMGWEKFKATCKKYKSPISTELAKRAISSYRSLFSGVAFGWKVIERACIYAINHPGQRFNIRTPDANGLGAVIAETQGPHLTILLPSGRRLWYINARIRTKLAPWGELCPQIEYEATGTGGKVWWRETTYGGKLTENVVQAICRDLLANKMLACEAANLPIVMHTHDEPVPEVPIGSNRMADMRRIMLAVPPEYTGFPINCSGYESAYYKKG